ncbi:Bifunctional uridylyltransferase/uridylyl-removing enzyme [Corynebacterium endometrii]|uniref:Bifunctional uridylyltransferase/uridylyl-removing enzyme n=2 Tax=Corynebacterium endometrii TaxID=2488819 RepID=A0A4P7QG53_9CORY|nr:Bifunctional uridylyltransferase/uridylyl-removing enzyme [Corynebacterium endometrii]
MTLSLPEGTTLAATGSFARREMTPRSDLDFILIHPAGMELDEEEISQLWYPIWDAKYHLDYSIRTPEECANIAHRDPTAGFSQLDLAFIQGDEGLFSLTRSQIVRNWRVAVSRHFDSFIESAIARWRRSGSVAMMTNPEIKNGRGGLRDLQLLHALALGQLSDEPDLGAERELLLDVRTLLHVHSRRHRDVLAPEFAADVAHDLGYEDRYGLTSDIVKAAISISNALEQALATARGVVGKRSSSTTRKPLDVDVVDVGGEVTLSRRPDLNDPALVLRVAAASARTGHPVAEGTWERLTQTPPMPERWSAAAADDFFAILSSPEQTPRIILDMDRHGLWERFVPEWGHIRGRMPRERTHTHTIDFHSINTVVRCAENRTLVGRPDLLLLAALFHDMGKGYGRPHEQVGAEMVTKMAAKLRLHLADRSRVQTIVAEHTTLARLAASADPHADSTRDAVLDATHYDLLTLQILKVLAEADAKSTGPGVWTPRVAQAIEIMVKGASDALAPQASSRPMVSAPTDVGLRIDEEESCITVHWRGSYQREVVRVLALIYALGWNIQAARMVRRGDGGYSAEFDCRPAHETLEAAADEVRFIQSYKSGVYSTLPGIQGGPTTAMFATGGVFVVRTVDRRSALGHLLSRLPDVEWLTMANPGATMIVKTSLRGNPPRQAVVRNVTEVLVNG